MAKNNASIINNPNAKSTSTFVIEQIKIMLDLGENKPSAIPFTSSMLYHPDLQKKEEQSAPLSEFPYFNADVVYPFDILSKLDYKNKVKFFFNKAFFEKILFASSENYNLQKIKNENQTQIEIKLKKENLVQEQKKLETISIPFRKKRILELESEIKNVTDTKYNYKKNESTRKLEMYKTILKKYESRLTAINKEIEDLISPTKRILKKYNAEIVNENIHIMLELLFPTKYPRPDNLSDSFTQYIQQKTTPKKKSLNIMQSERFSYIKEGNDILTITNVIWLNDMVNNPIYRKFMVEFANYIKWSMGESEKIKEEIETKENALFENLKTEDSDAKKGSKSLKITEDEIKEIESKIDFVGSSSLIYNRTLNGELVEIVNNLRILNAFLALNTTEFNEMKKNKNNKINITISEISFDNSTGNKTSKTISFNELIKKLNTTNTLYKKNTNQITNNALNRKLTEIFNELSKISTLRTINDKYIGKGSININNVGEDPDVIKELTDKYKQYSAFVATITKLIKPENESSNNTLQSLIYNYSQNTEEGIDTLQMVINEIQSKYVNLSSNNFTSDKEKKYVYTGINIVDKEPHIEIYVQMDTILGELTDLNKGKIDCLYKGDYLGSEFENLLGSYNKYIAYKNRIKQFSVKEAETKIANDEKNDKVPDTNQPITVAGGGAGGGAGGDKPVNASDILFRNIRRTNILRNSNSVTPAKELETFASVPKATVSVSVTSMLRKSPSLRPLSKIHMTAVSRNLTDSSVKYAPVTSSRSRNSLSNNTKKQIRRINQNQNTRKRHR